jgi:hypothetical protein
MPYRQNAPPQKKDNELKEKRLKENKFIRKK